VRSPSPARTRRGFLFIIYLLSVAKEFLFLKLLSAQPPDIRSKLPWKHSYQFVFLCFWGELRRRTIYNSKVRGKDIRA
jgi:hypothetical protein